MWRSEFTANGKTIPWKRDLLDVFTFSCGRARGSEPAGNCV